jgi:hypothetical protein
VFAKCIDELLAIPGAELALIIVDASSPIRTTTWQKIKRALSFQGSLWALAKRVSPLHGLSCYRPTDMAKVFDGVPRIHCKPVRKGKFSQYFTQEDISTIRTFQLDFILRFAFGIIRGDILETARYGVWSFHHGDETKFRGAPPAFWEIYHDEPVTGAILQRLTDRLDAGVVLQRSFVQTRPYSHGANLNAIMWATTHMPARVCRDILNGTAQYLETPPSLTDAPIYYTPNDFQMAKFLLKTATSWVKNQWQSVLFSPDWNIGIVRAPIHAFLDPGFRPEVRWLGYRKPGHYIADPFVLKLGSNLSLLAEEFNGGTGRGSIIEMNLDETHMATPSFRCAIDEGVHMSYPYLFEYNGSFYCTPEAYRKKGVYLYRFDIGRREWTYAATLIRNFAAVDPTPFEYDGRWWMLCTNYDDDVETKLFLWHSPQLEGPWEPHVANPVKTDVRSSRPAGRPFVVDGLLYRPAQDSSRSYGSGISINRILRLTTQEFVETTVRHLGPIAGSRYKEGIHTLVGCGPLTVIDGKRYIFTPGVILRRMKRMKNKLVRLCAATVRGT